MVDQSWNLSLLINSWKPINNYYNGWSNILDSFKGTNTNQP